MSTSSGQSLLRKAFASLVNKGPHGLGRDVHDYLRWRLSQLGEGSRAQPKARSNWDLNQEELRSLPEILRSKPVLVYAEASTRCNLHCFMCRLSFPETTRRTRQHMELATYVKLEPLLEPGSRLSLFGLGEPLLNPSFVEMLRIAKDRGAFVGLNSNAMLLTERIARAMVELGQDLLVVSFSGGTPETYERVITGASFERVVGNLRRLNEIKMSAASRHHPTPATPLEQVKPVLQLQFTAMRDNVRELPDVVRLALELRCAGVVVMPLTIVDPSLAEQSLLNPEVWSAAQDAFAEARRVAETAEYDFDLQLPALLPTAKPRRTDDAELLPGAPAGSTGIAASAGEPLSPICYEPWQTFYVRDDGTVNTCCYSNRVLGDLRRQSALEVWNGEPYRRFRARMRSANKPAECRVCHKLRGDDWYDQRVEDVQFYDEL